MAPYRAPHRRPLDAALLARHDSFLVLPHLERRKTMATDDDTQRCDVVLKNLSERNKQLRNADLLTTSSFEELEE